jgi:cell division protease FtsH
MDKPKFSLKPKGSEPPPKGAPPWRFPIWYFILMLLLLWMWQETFSHMTVRTISYSEFKAHLARREVTEVAIKQDELTGKIVPRPQPAETNQLGAVTNALATAAKTEAKPGPAVAAPRANPLERILGISPSGPERGPNEPFVFRTVRVEDPKLVEELEAAGAKFTGVRPSVLGQFLLAWVLPLGLMILLWVFLSRRLSGTGAGLLSIGKSKAKLIAENATGVTFDDVAGCEEAKFELQEIVGFLKNPDRYKSLGARIPKGALLVGPPGTGKTLLARAVAGEARVPFFSLSGSEFVEMFVGVGAARVRDLFQQAKAQAPCIVFIDELDAIGRQRGVHVGAVNDEREQTLNQLLVEMDGFEANAGVIILAATNRPEVLDRALLRPGRFDRQILVDSPDADGREAILKVHAKNKPLAPEVNLRRVAQATAGFSGADLANTMNEAALLAARRKSSVIGQQDLEEAIEKVVAGPERKSRRLGEEEKRRVAYHEVGHALIAAYSKGADPVHKISIVPRGRAALGYTMQLPAEDQFLLTRSELLDRIRGLLGGRAAEETVFGDVTTGAENDLDRATSLARQMVCMFGMSDKVGLAHCAQKQSMFLGPMEMGPQRDCSEETAREIDEEVKKILDRCYAEAKEMLSLHRDELEVVTAELLKRETLDAEAFYRLIGKPMPQSSPEPSLRAPVPAETQVEAGVAATRATPPPVPRDKP